MSENLTFHFEGALANDHTLNFYEASRFQYAAARLIVKLGQFQASGKFQKNITNTTNRDILLRTHDEGSFDISVIAPFVMAAQDAFINAPISSLMSYVFERIIGKPSNSDMATALNTHKDVVATIGNISDNDNAKMQRAFDIIEKDQDIKNSMHEDLKQI